MPEPADDPRPLTGEPISLDLLNTRWIEDSRPHDLLDSTAGLAIWLRSNGLDADAEPDRPTLDALLDTREALRTVVDGTLLDAPSPEAGEALNRVLEHGALHYRLRAEGPETHPETDAPKWLPAWLAAADYLKLLTDRRDRIRRCAHPDCVLYFLDTTKNATRRWCSMAVCGNRAKAARHYKRTKGT